MVAKTFGNVIIKTEKVHGVFEKKAHKYLLLGFCAPG